MKYFNNINNAEELRAKYRAYCLTMHPDRGGNEEEFKAMQSEFETLKKQYQSGARFEQYAKTETAEERARREAEEAREREEWARWEAEEKARREQEEREKAERIRKAQEVSRAAVRAWAGILERIPEATAAKKRAYDFEDKKAAAAYIAATKRNIKAVINHYFPNLKVKVNISGRIWREEFAITWEDGPSEKQLRDTCKELAFFIPSYYECDPYADYGNYNSCESTSPWREAYGQALGDCTEYKTTRTLSEEGKKQAEEMAAKYFANFDPKSDAETFEANLQELHYFAGEAGFYDVNNITDIFRSLTGQYYADMYGACDQIKGTVSRWSLYKMMAEHVAVNVVEKPKAPEFVPTYGPTFKAIKKALGANEFCINPKKSEAEKLSILEAAEMLARGEAVAIGKYYEWEGKKHISGLTRGGYKTQEKRREKFAAAGVILENSHYNTYGTVQAVGIDPETLEALRREAADIEEQRRAWEEGQRAKKSENKAQKRTKAAQQDNTPQEGKEADTQAAEAPADGLQLIETADGVAVVSDDWKTTYFNKKHIKAHGCHWNSDLKRWEATDPADVLTVRAWFAMRDGFGVDAEPTTEKEKDADEQPQTIEDEQPAAVLPEWAKDGAKVYYIQNGERIKGFIINVHKAFRGNRFICEFYEDNNLNRKFVELSEVEPMEEETEEPKTERAEEITAFVESLADVLRIFADIMQQAKQWEGVTIPAETLEKWKEEAETGTKSAAARFAEVCACLGSLTPESRKQFDALGLIFWSLSEQLRQGADPETIEAATGYARGQLYDLISRTQSENQARAIKAATEQKNTRAAA